MPTLSWLRHAWRNLLRGRRADLDLDGELQAHLDLLMDEKMRAGLTRTAARRQARIELGSAEALKETVRAERSGAVLDIVVRDVRFGARVLARRPLFSAVAVVTLALGIGAATSVFSVVNAVLLRPLPYAEPDRLAVVLHDGIHPVSPANYLDWKSQMRSFSEMAAAEFWRGDFVGPDVAEKLFALRVTTNMFPMLGATPLLGRTFDAAVDPEATAAREVILSHRLWQRLFAGDPSVLNSPIRLDGETYTIVGVMPAEFMFAPFWATKAELWAPLSFAGRSANRGAESLRVFARLRPDATLSDARVELAVVTGRLERQFEGTNRDVVAMSLTERVVGDVRPALLLLLTSVGFVLLMTCANVAHMLIAHGAARQREFGMRLALGASRARLVLQVLTESLLLVAAGGAAGLALAYWGVAVLRALGPADLPRLDTIAMDGRVVLFSVGASVSTGLLFAIAPALRAARAGLASTVRPATGPSDGSRRRAGRSALVAAQFGLALLLLTGAGLMIRSFQYVQAIEPGWQPEGLLSMAVSVTGAPAGAPGRRAEFFREAIAAVEALPGVRLASAVNHLPIGGDIWGRSFQIEGRPEPRPGDTPSATYRVALPGYFRTMDIPLRGRDFSAGDTLATERVVVVNDALAERYWPGEDALGRRFALRGNAGPPAWMTIVGIIPNVVQDEWLGVPREEMYLPFLQSPDHLTAPASHFAYLTLVIRTDVDPGSLTASVRDAIWQIEPGLPISDVQTMSAVVAAATAQPRFYMVLLSVFGLAAIALAAVGIYGVMSLGVAERRREIGIRLALGARPGRVLGRIVGRGLLLALTGSALGLIGSVVLAGTMATLVHGVQPTDPATFGGVVAVLTAVALVASYVPARRATRSDAMTTLKDN